MNTLLLSKNIDPNKQYFYLIKGSKLIEILKEAMWSLRPVEKYWNETNFHAEVVFKNETLRKNGTTAEKIIKVCAEWTCVPQFYLVRYCDYNPRREKHYEFNEMCDLMPSQLYEIK